MAATMPALRQLGGEAFVAGMVHRVVVRHHGQWYRHIELTSLVQDGHGRGAGIERRLRRLLDDGAVHHRVAERDADLDGVGTAAAAARTRPANREDRR
jgi:hypothetical protein